MSEQVTAPDPRLGEIEGRLSKATGRTPANGSFGDVLRIIWTTYYFGADLQWHNARTGDVEQAETLTEEIEASEGDWGWLAPAADVTYLLAELRKAQDALSDLLYVADHNAADTQVGRWWAEVIRGPIIQHLGDDGAARLRAAVAAATGGDDED